MSSQFSPSELYITPQCGEHQNIKIYLINFQKLTEVILMKIMKIIIKIKKLNKMTKYEKYVDSDGNYFYKLN
jgi:hypothetical protein